MPSPWHHHRRHTSSLCPRLLGTTGALLLVLSAGVHAAEAPPIKPGLWELTTDSQTMDGKPMPNMTAQMAERMKQMPPELRQQMDAQMKAQGIQMAPDGKAMAIRMCITRDMLDKNHWQHMEGRCQNTSLNRTGATWAWRFKCSHPPGEGEGTTTFQGTEAYVSDMKSTSQINGQTHTMTMKHHAKWLGADCGGLKPLEAPAKP